MKHAFTQRRCSPLVSTETGIVMALHVSVPVRLLRLSTDGLLLACRVPLRSGSTVRLSTELAGRRLEVELCVDQVSNRPDEAVGGYVLGGRPRSFDEATWRSVTALLAARVPSAATAAAWAA
jgi:hypothetical protein